MSTFYPVNILSKSTFYPVQVFSSEICEVFKNTFENTNSLYIGIYKLLILQLYHIIVI